MVPSTPCVQLVLCQYKSSMIEKVHKLVSQYPQKPHDPLAPTLIYIFMPPTFCGNLGRFDTIVEEVRANLTNSLVLVHVPASLYHHSVRSYFTLRPAQDWFMHFNFAYKLFHTCRKNMYTYPMVIVP